MDEEYYWIEITSTLFGFWGTVFKFWADTKEIFGKLSDKVKFCLCRIERIKRIRNPT